MLYMILRIFNGPGVMPIWTVLNINPNLCFHSVVLIMEIYLILCFMISS